MLNEVFFLVDVIFKILVYNKIIHLRNKSKLY